MITVSTQIAREDSLQIFEQALQSISFADEILIFNMERRDKEFQNLAAKHKARVIDISTPLIVEEVRSKEIELAKYDWVLVIDIDEIVTPALRQEIIEFTRHMPTTLSLRRRNFSLSRPLIHGGWGDDYVPRLFHKSTFISWPTNIHSTPLVRGEIIRSKNYLKHMKDATLTEMVNKTNRYSEVESQQFLDGHLSTVTPPTLMRKWWMESFRRGILKLGLLDGAIGLIQSIYQGFSVFISYAKLYEKQKDKL